MNDLNLILAAFFTSCLAGAMGMGGGVLLIALMPGLVPVAAIIPLHAATQLASNASLAYVASPDAGCGAWGVGRCRGLFES